MTRRPGPRRPGPAGAALLLLALLLAPAGPAGADSSPQPTAVDEGPLRVVVSTLLPRAPAPGQSFEVAGTLVNTGSQPVSGLRVQLRLGDRIFTRSGLHAADHDRPPTSPRGDDVSPVPGDLAPGRSVAFDLRTRVDALGLGDLGVYPLDVEATGRLDESVRTRLGTARTWLPWMAGLSVAPTKLAVLWPLVDQPRRGADDVLLDDSLATTLSDSGRLGRLLAVAAATRRGQCDGVPRPPAGSRPASARPLPRRCDGPLLTFALDPDLLQTVDTMTGTYSVQRARGSGARVPGRGRAAAAGWLARLRVVTRPADVLALPFADPDVAALSRDPGGRYDISLARSLGDQLVAELLGTSPLTDAAWPPPGPVPQAAQDSLAVDGSSALVLDSSAFPAPAERPGRLTPGARAPLPASSTGRTLLGLVPDPDLSSLVAGVPAGAAGPRLAEQRWIAETAIVAAEEQNVSRTLLIAPDRRTDVVPAAATAALWDIGRLPWLCPVPLADIARGEEHCPGRPAGPSPAPTYDRGDPRSDAAGQLSGPFLAGIAADRDAGVQLADSVLAPRAAGSTRTRTQLRRMVARAESSAWRADPAGGRQAADLLHTTVARLVGGLTVRGAPLLLTSTRGTLSVSVDNRLDVPVSCAVSFAPPAGAALSTYRTPVRLIPARSSTQFSVRATARTSGRFVVVARLLDTKGRAFGQPTQVDVRSTRYGRLALAVTGIGAGVLLVAAGLRIMRRALHSRDAARAAT